MADGKMVKIMVAEAVEIALRLYDTAMSDPITTEAAFGWGSANISTLLQVDMKTSCLIMRDALSNRNN